MIAWAMQKRNHNGGHGRGHSGAHGGGCKGDYSAASRERFGVLKRCFGITKDSREAVKASLRQLRPKAFQEKQIAF